MNTEDEKIVFEQAIVQNNDDDTLVVKLKTTGDASLAKVMPKSVIIHEAFSFGSPIITVSFVDGDGVLINLEKLATDDVYWLEFGDGHVYETIQRIPLRISKIESTNSGSGKAEQMNFRVTFIHSGWNAFINTRINRGWHDKTFSEVVYDVVRDIGYASVDVKQSRGKQESVIQPHWPNHIFLKWVQERAISERFDDHFEYACRLNNEFFFKSISDIIDENTKKAEDGDIPLLVLGGQEEKNIRTESKKDNKNTSTYITDFSSTEYYVNTIINGGGGVETMFYDFLSGTFNRAVVTQSISDTLQLSDWGSVNKLDENTNMKLFCGRDKNAIDRGFSKLSTVAVATNQLSVSMEASLAIRTGDMVELIIPSPEDILAPFSVMYSGFYIVASVSHTINMNKNATMTTKLELTRHGFDGVDLEGYIRTRLGMFLGERPRHNVRIENNV